MVSFCLDRNKAEAFKRGEPLTQDLKRVLDESGDPYWVECLLKDFREIFFKDSLDDYYSFAHIINFSKGFGCYMAEQRKRFERAISLKQYSLGRDLSEEERNQEIMENHISKDFRLYFFLEHPEFCYVDETKMEKNPFYREALDWLLSAAHYLTGMNYRAVIGRNRQSPRREKESSLALVL